MFYYIVESSHWSTNLKSESRTSYEFKSKIPLTEGQCFRIQEHDGDRSYPTRFKVLKVSDVPTYTGKIVEVFKADLGVESF